MLSSPQLCSSSLDVEISRQPQAFKSGPSPNLNISEHFGDFLYRGLPCVWDGTRYVVFSPYALKIARVPPAALHLDETTRRLERERFFGQPARPSQSARTARFGLIVTTGCNLRCKYCYVVPEAKPRMMSPQCAIGIIRERIKPNTEKVSLSFFGGEATLNMPVLKAAVEYVKSLGIPYQFLINTNGTAPDEDLDYMISNNFIFIVSSDGPPGVTDFQRPMTNKSGVSTSVERTIGRLAAAGSLFQVRPTVTAKSVSYLSEGIKYWSDLGVRFVHVEPVGSSKNSKLFELSCSDPNDYVSAITSALDEAERQRIWIISSAYMNLLTPSTYFCTLVAGEKEMYTPDGAISACYKVQEKDHSVADFIVGEYDASTDEFIRNDRRANHLRQLEVRSDGPCVTCHARYICAGGCPFRNLVETGNMLGVDPWSCFVKKALVHDAILRIARGLEEGRVPVVLGQSVFEHLVAESYISRR